MAAGSSTDVDSEVTVPESHTSPLPASAFAAVVATTSRYFFCSTSRWADCRIHENVGVASSIPNGSGLAFTSRRSTDTPVAAVAAPPDATRPDAITAPAATATRTLLRGGCLTRNSFSDHQQEW